LAHIQFEDKPNEKKLRPVLIIRVAPDSYVVAYYITTKGHGGDDDNYYKIRKAIESGLDDEDSVVRITRLLKIHKNSLE
jgi:hypothetical protein